MLLLHQANTEVEGSSQIRSEFTRYLCVMFLILQHQAPWKLMWNYIFLWEFDTMENTVLGGETSMYSYINKEYHQSIGLNVP